MNSQHVPSDMVYQLPMMEGARRQFVDALAAWKEDGRSLEDFFREEYDLSPTSIYRRAKFFGVVIPSNRRHDRRKVLYAQRESLTPPDVVAWRLGISLGTLRQWSSREKLPLKGNKPYQKRRWWTEQFAGVPLDKLAEHVVEQHLPPHLAAHWYAQAYQPEEAMCWDFSEDPPVVVHDWSGAEFAEALADTIPVDEQTATIFLIYRDACHAVRWPEEEDERPEAPADDPNVLRPPGMKPIYPGDPVIKTSSNGSRLPGTYYGLDHQKMALFRSHKAAKKRPVPPIELFHADDPKIEEVLGNA